MLPDQLKELARKEAHGERWSHRVLGETDPQGVETYQTWPGKGILGDVVYRIQGQHH